MGSSFSERFEGSDGKVIAMLESVDDGVCGVVVEGGVHKSSKEFCDTCSGDIEP